MILPEETRQTVRAVVAETFSVERSKIENETGPENLEEWDSLSHLQLIMALELELGVRFSTEQIARPKSVAELDAVVEEALAQSEAQG